MSEIEEVIEKIKSLEKLSDLKPKDYADKNGYADKIAKNSKNLKSTQLRKFFGAIKSMEKKLGYWDHIESEFYLLKPQIAYAKGRNLIPEGFYNVIIACMEKIDKGTEEEKRENFKTFINFMEAIVAYHKFYEGERGR